MNPLFEVGPREVALLAELPFADLLNRLLRAEGNRSGWSPTNIQTSLRISDPDGGIDARVRDADNTSRWVPPGLSIWQFKSGDISPKELQNEFRSAPAVQESIHRGVAYCLVVGEDLSDPKTRHREETLRRLFLEQRLEPKFRLMTASHVAEWASEHPAVCFLPYFPRPVYGDFMRWEKWADLSRFRNEFRSDGQRHAIISAVRQCVNSQSALLHVRVEGLAGVGKTRLALEALRSDTDGQGLSERAMYACRVADIPTGLFHWLEVTAAAALVLVVDECDRVEADRLMQQAERCQGRLRLLTIGQAQEARVFDHSRRDAFLLQTLAGESMRDLLQVAFPALPKDSSFD
jgi:hypothetical protein